MDMQFRREAERSLQRHGEAFGGDGRLLAAGDPRSTFLNFPGALSVAWQALQDIADDLDRMLAGT